MANETDVNFDYIPRRRYIIEIKNERTGKSTFGKRLGARKIAEAMKNKHNQHIGIAARIHDTKTGEII